ncbi:hypothetical protein O9X98_06990 [Agrobacterium salinitolerans]|nr:hypothetical protein [Agrobacterium salinitolerans]
MSTRIRKPKTVVKAAARRKANALPKKAAAASKSAKAGSRRAA